MIEKEQSVARASAERTTASRSDERSVPGLGKASVKKVCRTVRQLYARYHYIEKGRFVEFGHGFRFTREEPYRAYVGDGTIAEDFNAWCATRGDIVVGKHCWLGLYDIVMGPLEIGDDTETGPGVKILGPDQATFKSDLRQGQKTIIGRNVRMLADTIILFGVRIGDNAVISAGSVVDKDVPDGAFVAGNPARDLSAITHRMWDIAGTKGKASGDGRANE